MTPLRFTNTLRALAMVSTTMGAGGCRSASSIQESPVEGPQSGDQSGPAARREPVLPSITEPTNAADVPAVISQDSAQNLPNSRYALIATCPMTRQVEGRPCADFQPGLRCEWNGTLWCVCKGPTATEPTQQWSCVARSVPGPLPPPELLA